MLIIDSSLAASLIYWEAIPKIVMYYRWVDLGVTGCIVVVIGSCKQFSGANEVTLYQVL